MGCQPEAVFIMHVHKYEINKYLFLYIYTHVSVYKASNFSGKF